MALRVQHHLQCHPNVSKQSMLLDGLGVIPLKWPVCGGGLILFVHEGMNNISNVKVHLKTLSGNVNILKILSALIYKCTLDHFYHVNKHYEP